MNGVIICTYTNKEEEMPLKITICVLGSALVFWLYALKRSRYQAKKRQAIVASVMS